MSTITITQCDDCDKIIEPWEKNFTYDEKDFCSDFCKRVYIGNVAITNTDEFIKMVERNSLNVPQRKDTP